MLIETILVVNAVQITTAAVATTVMRKAQFCDDCGKWWQSAKHCEFFKKGFRLILCEECRQIRIHKRTN